MAKMKFYHRSSKPTVAQPDGTHYMKDGDNLIPYIKYGSEVKEVGREVAQDFGNSANKAISQKAVTDELALKIDKTAVKQETGTSPTDLMSQNRITQEFLRQFTIMNNVYNNFVTLANSSLIYRDAILETVGGYLNWNNGEWMTNPSYTVSGYFLCEASKQYCFVANVHSYLFYDNDLNFISGGTVSSGKSPNPTPISPSGAVYVRVNFGGNPSGLGMYVGTTPPAGAPQMGFAYKQHVSKKVLKPVVYDNTDEYTINQTYIDNGVSDVILAAVCDVEYEEGFDYSFATANATNNVVTLYKHDKTVIPVTNASITEVDEFTLIEKIGNLTVLGSKTTRSRMIVDWSKLVGITTWSNIYAYNGLGVNPAIFRGNPLFSLFDILQANIDMVAAEVSRLDTSLHTIVDSVFQGSANIKNPTTYGIENGTWLNASSSFSGWGEVFGTMTGFNAVAVMIRGRAANTSPITEVRVRIRNGVDGRNGAVLYSGVVTGLNIGPSQIQKVVVKLDNIVDNPNGDLLWIEYLANNLLDRYGFHTSNYPYRPADDVTYPKCAYSLYGNFPSNMSAGESTNGYPFTVWYGMYEEFYELTDDQIENIAERMDVPTPIEETVDVNLPDVITAVVGDPIQLFFRGMVYAVDPYAYDLLVACTKGNKYPRYFQFNPSIGDVGDFAFKLSVKDNKGKVLGTAQSTLKVRSAVKSPDTNINICCFGDSLTSAGTWCREGDRRLTGTGGTPAGLALTNITFCGSKKNGTTGYFGVGGWQWTDYTTRGRAAFRFQVSGVTTVSVGAVYTNNGYNYTVSEVNVTSGSGNILCDVASFSQVPQLSGTLTKVSGNGDATIAFSAWEENSQNPLWNNDTNQMDFVPYANAYCNGKIDAVYTLLSWNGQSPWKTDFTTVIANVKIFADTLHRDFPNAKLKIMGIQIPSVNGGMGANYGATGTGYADGYGNVITALNQNKAYQDFANQAEYKDFVEFVNVSTQVDSEYNMPYSNVAVNTRNSDVTEMRGTNGVHPSTKGYYQIGDVLFRNVIKEFCQ